MLKTFFLLLFVIWISFSRAETIYFSLINSSHLITDSNKIIHKLDGKINEWPEDKFTTDKITSIQFAIDNDAQNLYMALKIQSIEEQTKMMRLGMNLYFDIKGKRKENLGIEFPLNNDIQNNSQGYERPIQQLNAQTGKPDLQKLKMTYAINLLSMKLFGFGTEEPVKQNLETDGSAKIAFSWDSTDVMMIEYMVPLNMLGEIPSLNQKTISIGCKVNGIDATSGSSISNPPVATSSRLVAVRSGTRPTGGTPANSGSANNSNTGKTMQEQKTWIKYIINIPL